MTKKKPAEKPAEQPTEKGGDDQGSPPVAVVPPITPEVEKPEPVATIQVDLSKITAEDFPKKVELKVDYTISEANSGVTMQFKKGTMVKPLRIEGDDLIIQPVGLPVESKINVDQTNFKELAVPKMLERLQNTVANQGSDPVPPVASEDTSTETPTETPAPPTSTAKLDATAIVALLKADVGAGKVTEFKANQVTQWEAGEEMDFDGETYQTGHVTFKAETILGVQEHEAIALIQGGKVYKWMWAKTKLEMR